MKRIERCTISLGLLLGVAGCHAHEAPIAPLSVSEARGKIEKGMSEADVMALMGKPWREGTRNRKILGPSGTYADGPGIDYACLSWHEGNEVTRVLLTNNHVTSTEVRHFPKWAMDVPICCGMTRNTVKKDFGPPSRIVKKLSYPDGTCWVYTDNKESEQTMLLTFDAKGQVVVAQIDPMNDDEIAGKVKTAD